jgi:aminoglycoside phosphotransferase (APT) family kinase protein
MDEPALRAAISNLIQHQTGAEAAVNNLERLSGGSSTENWSFIGSWTESGRPYNEELILRRAPEREIVSVARANEFHLLRALRSASFPVPRAFWMDEDGRWLQRPAMILQRCRGVADRGLLMDRNKARQHRKVRQDLAQQMVDQLSALHKIDVDALDLPAGLAVGSENPARYELSRQEQEIARYDPAEVLELRLAQHWLSRNIPSPPKRRVLVHGDFRPANVLTQDGSITAILDWELAHVGDPAEDIGWYAACNYRAEHFIEGCWAPQDFIDRYERVSGAVVDRQAVAFWSVFATFKLVCIALATISAFRKGDQTRAAFMPAHLITTLLNGISDLRQYA